MGARVEKNLIGVSVQAKHWLIGTPFCTGRVAIVSLEPGFSGSGQGLDWRIDVGD